MNNAYDQLINKLHSRYPAMFAGSYGGVAVDMGWWPILETLCYNIQTHIDNTNTRHAALTANNPHKLRIPALVDQVVVEQIKEKFGGLRFYYEGGDEYIAGLVQMAEAWASRACEQCGKPGRSRTKGWIKVLCEEHHEQRKSGTASD